MFKNVSVLGLKSVNFHFKNIYFYAIFEVMLWFDLKLTGFEHDAEDEEIDPNEEGMFIRNAKTYPGYLRVAKNSPGYVRVARRQPGYIRVAKSQPNYIRVARQIPNFLRIARNEARYIRVARGGGDKRPELTRVRIIRSENEYEYGPLIKLVITRLVCHQWSPRHTHSRTSNHYSHLKFVLFCEILKSGDRQTLSCI